MRAHMAETAHPNHSGGEQPVPTVDYAPGAAIVSEPICGKPIRSAPGDPDMICARPAGHDPTPWCGFDAIAERAYAAQKKAQMKRESGLP
jgi:hypothetical protein